MTLLQDPKLFNYILLALYAGAAVRWAIAGSWADVNYWLAAAWITATMTWGYTR